MRLRHLLLAGTSVAALCGTAVSTTGVLAAFTDTASTGASGDPDDMDALESAAIDVESANADIKIAHIDHDPDCGEFRDDLQLPIVAFTDVEAGTTDLGADLSPPGVCLKNVGTDAVDVTLQAVDIASYELTCEPGEGEEDPQGPTCGDLGESAEHVRYRVSVDADCPINPVVTGPYRDLGSGPTPAVTMQPGDVLCLSFNLAYEPGADAVAAQTDRAVWRFRFDAEVHA